MDKAVVHDVVSRERAHHEGLNTAHRREVTECRQQPMAHDARKKVVQAQPAGRVDVQPEGRTGQDEFEEGTKQAVRVPVVGEKDVGDGGNMSKKAAMAVVEQAQAEYLTKRCRAQHLQAKLSRAQQCLTKTSKSRHFKAEKSRQAKRPARIRALWHVFTKAEDQSAVKQDLQHHIAAAQVPKSAATSEVSFPESLEDGEIRDAADQTEVGSDAEGPRNQSSQASRCDSETRCSSQPRVALLDQSNILKCWSVMFGGHQVHIRQSTDPWPEL